MMEEFRFVDVRTRRRWRAWLERHHAKSPGVWLVIHKVHTGVESVPFDEAIKEAICFGWIDSLVRRLDDDRYVLKFTPRKPSSKWSDTNRKHWKDLKELGMLAPAGIAAAPGAKRYKPPPSFAKPPAAFVEALKKNGKAWQFFTTLPPSHRREYLRWIYSAVRPETRARRLAETVRWLSAGKKLGMR
jgi:uncharacterized protein YdeI (YjbR/CyaY-like superfamily)